MAATTTIPRRLPLLLVRDNVLLPGSSMRIPVRSHSNINMVRGRLLSKSTLSSTVIGVVPKDPDNLDTDLAANIHPVGTAAVVVQVTGTNWPNHSYTLLVTGLCRFKVEEILQESPYPVVRVTQLDKLPGEETDELKDDKELSALAENFRENAAKLVDMLDVSIPVVARLKRMLENLPSHHLPDICASIVKASYSERVQVLDAVDLTERFKRTLPLLMRQIEGLELLQKAKKNNVDIMTGKKFKPFSSKKFLRGVEEYTDDDEEDSDDIDELELKIKTAKMPDAARKSAMKDLRRLKKMTSQTPEHGMIRNYLELMADLPWSVATTDMIDLEQARNYLDEDHYGLEKLKQRVLEYLAVRTLKNDLKGPILCFVGPPGVGKTSVGRSIARTMGRKFHRIALGGVYDQSDIRGHRRTYIGSMPGRIIQGIKAVGVNNPVFLLDEVDKLSKGMHGDPSAALLEVLDPEQNKHFVDHYLNVPFDLSHVMFIATANNIATIPPALLDRMEIIRIPGYTLEEKVHIAQKYLIPKQTERHGLNSEKIHIPDLTIETIVSKYTRESGVRNLERELAAVCRAVAVRVAKNKNGKSTGLPVTVDSQLLEDLLGPPSYDHEASERLKHPGVVIGLAWTPFGGEIMFVEATKMDGEGKVVQTGMLGDVMKESAILALNWVRSNAHELDLPNATQLSKKDVHIHFPAGAVGKDGPSAGCAIVTVLVSLFSARCVRSDTAMTGEITLRGLVLPVGGIKEKVLAAHRAGIQRVILPKRNEKDLREIPTKVRTDLTFIFVTRVEEVLQAAFDGGFPPLIQDEIVPKIVPSKL